MVHPVPSVPNASKWGGGAGAGAGGEEYQKRNPPEHRWSQKQPKYLQGLKANGNQSDGWNCSRESAVVAQRLAAPEKQGWNVFLLGQRWSQTYALMPPINGRWRNGSCPLPRSVALWKMEAVVYGEGKTQPHDQEPNQPSPDWALGLPCPRVPGQERHLTQIIVDGFLVEAFQTC